MVEPKFKKGDYIINRASGDMAIVDSVTAKNYYHFKAYYGSMFNDLKDVKNKLYDLQVDYRNFMSFAMKKRKRN